MEANPKDLQPADDTLWEPDDVARFLKASRSWVYHAAQRGDLPCLRISRMLRFDPAAVRAWAKGHATSLATVVSLASAKK